MGLALLPWEAGRIYTLKDRLIHWLERVHEYQVDRL